MITAFKQFFKMFFVLFSAGEKLANSVDKLALYADESTDNFLQEARIERQARIDKLKEAKKLLPVPDAA